MNKIILLLASLFLLTISTASASMDPFFMECMQRGYESEGIPPDNYCVFPDGSRCPMLQFNNGTCGKEFKIEDYCVKEGDFVWDKDKCCLGMEPYLKCGYTGQQTCRKIPSFFAKTLEWLGCLFRGASF